VTPITFAGNQTLGGTGEIVLPDTSYGRIQMANVAETLVHAADHTIRGAGSLFANSGNLDNYGRILATGTKSLIINPYTLFRNLEGSLLGGTGTFEFPDGLTANAGIISPGLSVGTLTIKGNVSNAETAIHLFELGGAEISESDRLIVEGTLALGGELRLALVGSYIPEPEAEFTLLTATALTGAFSNAIPEAGSIASNVVTDIGICDIVYDFSSSPKTVKVTNIQSSPELLRIFGVSTGAGVNRIDFAPSSLSWMYKLQYRVNLCTGEWADVPGQGPRPGIGRRDTMIHTNDLPCGFYRILGELSDSP
ncbi:MAG: hypothetical protein MUC65_08645, partial [Pontiellaceae bacterium]|nr:hypothetical protein [Pontiellaceae bacterium]